MRDSAADTREDVVRTKGVQDHEAGLFTKLIFWRAKRRYGHVPLSTRIRANDSKLLALAELMSRYTSASGTVPPKLKELVQLKVAAMVGCPLWIDIHSAVSRKAGITEEQLSDLSQFENSPHFSNEEKLVLRLAVSLTRTPSDVCDELYEELRRRFSERELVELDAAICWENYRARFNRTFAVEAEGFSKGMFCALPERWFRRRE
jgi:AhpD family alkylhydroperoxidase